MPTFRIKTMMFNGKETFYVYDIEPWLEQMEKTMSRIKKVDVWLRCYQDKCPMVWFAKWISEEFPGESTGKLYTNVTPASYRRLINVIDKLPGHKQPELCGWTWTREENIE